MSLIGHDGTPRWFDVFDGTVRDWPFGTPDRPASDDEDHQPNIEEFTEDGQIVVRAELPGVDPDADIEVSIVDGELCIHAERRQHDHREGRSYRRSEIRYGSLSRVLPLPPGTSQGDVSATYRDGVLEVRAPFQPSAPTATRIPVIRP